MSVIIWLIKAQWGFSLDRLTYEKLWCIDRVSNLLIGIINVSLILMSLLHQSNWLIPLALFNMSVLISSLAGKGLLHRILSHVGFQEREKILHQLRIEVQAREKVQNYSLKHDKIVELYKPISNCREN